jgi:hypothetical protein
MTRMFLPDRQIACRLSSGVHALRAYSLRGRSCGVTDWASRLLSWMPPLLGQAGGVASSLQQLRLVSRHGLRREPAHVLSELLLGTVSKVAGSPPQTFAQSHRLVREKTIHGFPSPYKIEAAERRAARAISDVPSS